MSDPDLDPWPAAGFDLDSGGGTGVFARPWRVAAVAVAAGLVIDTLALHQPPGLGLALGLMLGLAAAGSLGALLGEATPRGLGPILAGGAVVAAFVAIRTSPVLITLNVVTVAGLIAIVPQMFRALELRQWTITRYFRQSITTLGEMAVGGSRFVGTDLREGFGAEQRARVRSVFKGVAVGIPLLAIFGGLMASADAVFSKRLRATIDGVFFGSVLWRLVFTGLLASALAGLWRSSRNSDPAEPIMEQRQRMDRTTGVTVLALLVALFLFFVVTQVVGHSPEMLRSRDYSDNARRGFFQLVAVAFLVLNVLLSFDWMTRSEDGRRSPAFDRLAVVLIGLTGLVMASALNRMRLYVAEFGLTELRFYTTVFMFWLAFVLVWFMWTVLRNRHATFALGLMASAVAFVVGLNVANPDALIVNANWQRHLDGADFSDEYLAELSVDSIPALVAIREASSPGQWCFIERRLSMAAQSLQDYSADHGLLAGSWAVWRARQALADIELVAPSKLACTDPG